MAAKSRKVEEILARLAGASHGVVTRCEALRAGVTSDELGHRIAIGALIRVHRGVFRVGHAAPSLEARYLAAVKAAGEDALLAGRAAGHLFGLLRGSPQPPEVISGGQRRPCGVIVHRAAGIKTLDAARWRGIPVTSIPRTLVDLAAVLPEDELARAFHEAAVRHGTTPKAVERVLGRRHNWPGARRLRRVLWGEVPVTLSRLESLFVQRLQGLGLPQPEMNRLMAGRRVDCRWPEHRLTVELDGYRYHHTRHAWEQDRQREREARAKGDEFRRYTWADVVESPDYMLRELSDLLGPS